MPTTEISTTTTAIDIDGSPTSTPTLARRTEISTVATSSGIPSLVRAHLGQYAGGDEELVRAAVALAAAADTPQRLQLLKDAAMALAELAGLAQFSPLYTPERRAAYMVCAASAAASGQSPVSVG